MILDVSKHMDSEFSSVFISYFISNVFSVLQI